jgi:hypothetical protein
MEFKFINPFSEEFLKKDEQYQNLKNNDEDAIVIISYYRRQDNK